MSRVLFMAFIFLSYIQRCTGREWQETRDTVWIRGGDIGRRVVEAAAENVDVSPILDNLRRLEEDPLDISKASAAELQQIPGVSAQAAFRIVSYRKKHAIECTEDFRNIQGLEPELIGALKPYISFPGMTSRGASHPALSMRVRMVRKLSQTSDFEDGSYFGTPERVYVRITGRFSVWSESLRSKAGIEGLGGSSVSFGLLTSKDPGEKNYADLVRGQVVVNLPGYSTRLVLGDYLVDGGQGLVFWRPTGYSKGGETTSGVARNGTGVWPSLSTGQTLTFRGIGVNTQPQPGLSLHLFYSNKLLDATADSTGSITRLLSDDLHRTESELAKKNRLREKAAGARLTVDLGGGVKIGMSGFSSQFDGMVRLSGPFGFQGNQASAMGLDGLYADGSVSAFAEIAQDQSKALAAVVGFTSKLRLDLSFAFLFRSYSRSYNNFHSSGFSESGDGCKNESGMYAGLTYHPTYWLSVAAYVDQFTYPWRSYASLLSSQGEEYFFRADLRVRQNLGIGFQIRQKFKVESSSLLAMAGTNEGGSERRGRNTFRTMLRFDPAGTLRWQNCLEIVTAGLQQESVLERGVLFFQDLNAVVAPGLSLSVRAVMFHTDSYDSRVYEYEADLPGAYSSPALFGKGIRWYVLGRYRWGQNVSAAVKYSRTSKEKSREGSSDADQQLSLQLDLEL